MRAFNRFRTDEIIECIVEGRATRVALYNLSCGGCMIESPYAALDKDAPIDLRLADNIKLSGRIAWRIDKNAGIRFDQFLHPSIVERLGYDEEEEFDRDDPRDRFGIPLVGMIHAGAGRKD